MSKLLFSILLITSFFTIFQPHFTGAADGAVEKATTQALITTACAGTGEPPLCYNVLNAIASNPYLDPVDITIFAVQVASKAALATFDIINMSLTVSANVAADPAVRQSLEACATEYKNVLGVLDKTTNALTQKVNQSEIPQDMDAAIAAVSKCDASGIKVTNAAVQVAAKNVDVTKLIKNAMAIFKVFAEYIANPSHDPSKTIPSNPGVGVGSGGAGGGRIPPFGRLFGPMKPPNP